MQLIWPEEAATPPNADAARLVQARSNICLDFHGDLRRAQLVVFSDGNHHMALAEALALFRARQPGLVDIFYATTPPRVIVQALKSGELRLGNLALSAAPHVFISPLAVLEPLREEGYLRELRPFASGRGSVMLVRKGNPLRIVDAADLARAGLRIFLSNPVTERVSYEAYAAALRGVAAARGLDFSFLDAAPGASARVVHGECIHHREAPQCLADGRADVAIVFYHLALRYVRIFPELFEMVAFATGGEPAAPASSVHLALVGDGGQWGARLAAFLLGEEVAAVYRHHGLVPAA